MTHLLVLVFALAGTNVALGQIAGAALDRPPADNPNRSSVSDADPSGDFYKILLQATGGQGPAASRPWNAPVVARRLSDSASGSSPYLEFKVSSGDQVLAPVSSKVLRIGATGGSPAIMLDHGSGFFSTLSGPISTLVTEGSAVQGGQPIARVVGRSGSRAELKWSAIFSRNPVTSANRESLDQIWASIESTGAAVDAVALLGMTLINVELNPAPSGRQFEIQLNGQTLDTLSANRPPIWLLVEPGAARVSALEGAVFKSVRARDTATLDVGERVTFTLSLETAYQAQPRQVTIDDQMVLRHDKSTEVMRAAAGQIRQLSPNAGPTATNLTATTSAPSTQMAGAEKTLSVSNANAGAAQTSLSAPLAGSSPAAVAAAPVSQPTPTAATPAASVAPVAAALRPESLSSQPLASSPATSNRKALVVGNDRYTSVTPLQNARADAQAIGKTLASLGYKVSVRLDLDERQMKTALRDFRMTLEGGDEVVFFFAGHGVQLGTVNYLLPVDIRGESEEQIRDDAMPLNRILDDLADRRVKLTLAIIDACRDNPFPRTGRSLGGRARGLAPTSAASGQMVVYSAGSGQQALDRLSPDDRDPNGLFTRMLLREMATPGMRIDSVIREVRKRVVEAARAVGHEQVPAVYDQVVGDFYFVR